jgi:hypothetical protein
LQACVANNNNKCDLRWIRMTAIYVCALNANPRAKLLLLDEKYLNKTLRKQLFMGLEIYAIEEYVYMSSARNFFICSINIINVIGT